MDVGFAFSISSKVANRVAKPTSILAAVTTDPLTYYE